MQSRDYMLKGQAVGVNSATCDVRVISGKGSSEVVYNRSRSVRTATFSESLYTEMTLR